MPRGKTAEEMEIVRQIGSLRKEQETLKAVSKSYPKAEVEARCHIAFDMRANSEHIDRLRDDLRKRD